MNPTPGGGGETMTRTEGTYSPMLTPSGLMVDAVLPEQQQNGRGDDEVTTSILELGKGEALQIPPTKERARK